MTKGEEQKVLVRDVRTHAIYLGIILASAFIVLICIKVEKNTDAVNYIGFAATLTSLILAILAIYIGLTGNSAILGFLTTAESFTRQGEAAQSALVRSGEFNHSTATALSQQADRFEKLVGDLGKKLDVGFEDLRNEINPNKSVATSSGSFDADKGYFLNTTSLTSICLIYTLSSFSESNTEFLLSDYVTNVNPDNEQYLFGCIIMISSFGIIKTYGDTQHNFRVTNCVFSASELRGELDRRIATAPSDAAAVKYLMVRAEAFIQARIETNRTSLSE